MKAHLVYSDSYNISVPGLDWLHVFDGRKFGRAWDLLAGEFGPALNDVRITPEREVNTEELLTVHTPEYLESLSSSSVIAQALEVGPIRWLPTSFVDTHLLRPMRYAAYGTVVAADAAVEPSIAVNLGGGFHHAFASRGEGFCIYADVAMAIQLMRRRGAIGPHDPIWVIDLDAHRGNGIEDIFGHDENVHFFDIYNFQIYPGPPSGPEKAEPPFLIPVKSRCSEEFYLTTLHRELDQFLESAPSPKLAFYNAGTDVVDGDPLGRLKVSEDGVFERDRYVIDSLRSEEFRR